MELIDMNAWHAVTGSLLLRMNYGEKGLSKSFLLNTSLTKNQYVKAIHIKEYRDH